MNRAKARRAQSAGTQPRFWNEAEIADFLRVSVRSVQGWRARGVGPPWVKLGTGRSARVRYSSAAFEKFLAAAERGGAQVDQ